MVTGITFAYVTKGKSVLFVCEVQIGGIVVTIEGFAVLHMDDEDVGRTKLLMEGFMPSLSTFLILWIFAYNLLHV